MSLIHGWMPATVQVITAAVLVVAIGRRSRRWRVISVPVALFVGVALTGAVFWFIEDQGLADGPAPLGLWVWITSTGLAAVVVVLGWRDVPWWRRGVSVLAVPLCVLCTALTVNMWVWLLPHGQYGMGPNDRCAAARADRPCHGRRAAATAQGAGLENHRVRENPRSCIGIQAP
jgi:hypothetical protein